MWNQHSERTLIKKCRWKQTSHIEHKMWHTTRTLPEVALARIQRKINLSKQKRQFKASHKLVAKQISLQVKHKAAHKYESIKKKSDDAHSPHKRERERRKKGGLSEVASKIPPHGSVRCPHTSCTWPCGSKAPRGFEGTSSTMPRTKRDQKWWWVTRHTSLALLTQARGRRPNSHQFFQM